MTPPRWRVWLVLALLAQLVVLYAPAGPQLPGAVPGLDKAVHALVFGAVTVTAVRSGFSPYLVAAYGLAHAGVSEALQHLLLPARTGDRGDVAADVVGVLAGLVLAARLSRHAGRRRTAPGP